MAKMPPIKVDVEIDVSNARREMRLEFRAPNGAWLSLASSDPAVVEMARLLGRETRLVERWVTEWVPVE